MNILLKRYRIKPDSADGILYIDGVRYCDTAEPTPLMAPEGLYTLEFRKHPVHNHRAPCLIPTKPPSTLNPQPESLNPSPSTLNLQPSTFIIHGNGVFHPTRGDILLGEHIVPGCVKCSRTYFNPLIKRLEKAFKRGTEVTLLITHGS